MKMETDIELLTPKKKKINNKKLLLSFLLFGMSLITFITATYAWFYGQGITSVDLLNIEIKTNDDLELSLDGYTWSQNLNINENLIKDYAHGGVAYGNNANSWVGEDGLIPVSSSGDNTAGRLDIYDKQALHATYGGYALISSQYDNSITEPPFYVAFDIFLKNNSGDTYKKTYNYEEDENIFLTKESLVSAIASGGISYGVQNSARVAFVQIGRVSLNSLVPETTPNITCSTPSATDKYTPLCNETTNVNRVAIWEPNELAHDIKLIDYYNTVCRAKSFNGTDYIYGGNCTTIANGIYTPTYTIKKAIVSLNNVDIYDGLNGYTGNIQTDQDAKVSYLQETATYTDTMKNTYDPENGLFRIHPYSVTKIRVYVYLEGQDVDNYDLVTEDQAITVSFGFTKNSYSNHDVDE